MSTLHSNLVQPGDIFFVDGTGWLDNVIEWAQNPLGKWARWSHAGIIIDKAGDILETTSTETTVRNLAADYAGSRIKVLRWTGMGLDAALRGMSAVDGQRGRFYPYWRLIVHLLHVQAYVHGSTMECSVLAAAYLKVAGFPLKRTPWWYGPAALADEMQENGCKLIFEGSLRKAGYIGENNA